MIRICEIEEEIRKIEAEQEEAEKCAKKFLRMGEDLCEAMQNYLSSISQEFEVCYGNQRMTYIVEEGYSLSLKALRECDYFISDLKADEKAVINECCSKLDELEQEKQVLEVIPV